jgi:pimeloyl-ACP methyl ester carboxylesterase
MKQFSLPPMMYRTILALLLAACARQPQPARVEEITFQSGEFTIVGELRTPEGTGPFPVVLFVHGSGPADRTGEGSYPPIIERMLRAGYATFSWDKPGTGESTGELREPTLRHQRAQIVLDAVEVMKVRGDIDSQRIGLWGISQAGYVMPLALMQSEDIAFMICISCPGMSGTDQTTYQNMAMALCTGTPKGQADRRTELLAELEAARTYKTYGEYVHYHEVIEALFGTAVQAPQGYGFGVVPEKAWLANDSENEHWWNPIEVIEQTEIPVLAIFGDKDPQMDPIQGAYAYRKAVEQAGNPLSRVDLFPKANHGIVTSETGCPADDLHWIEQYVKTLGYDSLSEAQGALREDPYNPKVLSVYPYAPEYLDLIEEWLTNLPQ